MPRALALTAALLTTVLATTSPSALAEGPTPSPATSASPSPSPSGAGSASPAVEATATPSPSATPTPSPSPSDVAPGPVTSLSATPAASTIKLTWVLPTDADLARVVVRRLVGKTAPATVLEGDEVARGLVTTHTDTALDWASFYSYTVFAQDVSGQWSAGTSLTTAPTDLPFVGPQATVQSPTSIKVAWAKPTDSRVAGVRLTRTPTCASTTPDLTVDLAVTTLTWTDTSLSRNQAVCYRLRAYDADNRLSRTSSSATSVRSWAAMPVTGLAATADIATLSARVTWTLPDDPEVVGVQVSRSGKGDGTDGVVYTGSATEFVDTGLQPERTYTYTVWARTASGLFSPLRTVDATPAYTWTADTVATMQGRPQLLSCPTTTWCMSIDRADKFLVLDGTTWSQPTPMRSVPNQSTAEWGATGLSCPVKGWCLSFGREGFQRYTGGAWASVDTTPQPPAAPYRSITCTSSTWCVAMTGDSRFTTLTGSTWAPLAYLSSLRGVQFHDVSCQAQGRCFAVGTYDPTGSSWRASLVNGRWSTASLARPGYLVGEIDCPTSTWCVASSRYGYWTISGTTWSAQVPQTAAKPPGDGPLSCSSRTSCWSGDWAMTGRRWNGTWWSKDTAIGSSLNLLTGIACPRGATLCHAVDDRGRHYQWTTTSSWRLKSTFDLTTGMLGTPSCPTADLCMAFDANGWLYTYDGSTWTRGIKYFSNPTTIDCTAAGFCMAVQDSGTVYRTFANGTWSAAKNPGFGTTTRAPSCGSPTLCLIFSDNAKAWRFNGTGWVTVTNPFAFDSVGFNGHVECIDATTCLGIHDSGWTAWWSGSKWSGRVALPPALMYQGSVTASCASTTMCLAVVDNGATARGAAGTWETVADAGYHNGYRLSGIDCLSATNCMGVQGYSNSAQPVRWDGLAWRLASPYGRPTASFGGIECPTLAQCFVFGQDVVTRTVPAAG